MESIAEAGRWSRGKTLLIIFLSGLGHVLSSIIIGVAGLLLGLTLTGIKSIERFRGDIAVWFLIVFGLLYALWGIRRLKHHQHDRYEKVESITP